MRRLALFALPVLASVSVAACSSDAAPSNVALSQNCSETTVSAPATAPPDPQFCGVGRYLSSDGDAPEEQDASADYVSMAFTWRGAKGVTFVITSGPPTVDNVFDIGSEVKLGIPVSDASCTRSSSTTGFPAFTTTAANGACPVQQKVAAGSGPLTYTVEVRKGDTVVDTLTVDIPFAAT
jgi:hypothetical protein